MTLSANYIERRDVSAAANQAIADVLDVADDIQTAGFGTMDEHQIDRTDLYQLEQQFALDAEKFVALMQAYVAERAKLTTMMAEEEDAAQYTHNMRRTRNKTEHDLGAFELFGKQSYGRSF